MDNIIKKYHSGSHPASFAGVQKAARHFPNSRKKLEEALSQDDSYVLHKPIKRKFKRRAVIVSGPGEQLQADLIDVSHLKSKNKGKRFILTGIDCFSRYGFAHPMPNKTGAETEIALNAIFDSEMGNKFKYLQTDRGMEFMGSAVQKMLKKRGIRHFSTFNDDMKASICERFNRTLKSRLWRYFSTATSYRYLEMLPKIIQSYNNTYHDTIKMKPLEVSTDNMEEVWWNIHDNDPHWKAPKYKPGQWVKIAAYKMVFDKGYTALWRKEDFIVHKALPTSPTTYKIRDTNNNVLQGAFYEQELQPISVPHNKLYRISKIVKKRGRGRNAMGLIRWDGYDSASDSWHYLRDIKQMV